MTNSVQYIIVRGDLVKTLKWPLGAVIAQCCHAATAVSHLSRDDEATKNYFNDLEHMHKVVLEANDAAVLIALSERLVNQGIIHKLWIEQPENIPTCIAVKPYPKEEVHKFVKELKLMR